MVLQIMIQLLFKSVYTYWQFSKETQKKNYHKIAHSEENDHFDPKKKMIIIVFIKSKKGTTFNINILYKNYKYLIKIYF